jgi:poly-gamma-glutamate synthesis protein (capsule biosynthesis protein)
VFSFPEKGLFYRLPLETENIFDFVSISAVGDIMIGEHTVRYINERGAFYPFAPTASIIQQADIAFANLEAPFTNTGTKFDKRFAFKVPPEFAVGLAQAGFDVLTLANNHILDYGIDGLSFTISTLDSLGIAYCGAGLNLEQARQPAILTIKNRRIDVLGYSMTYPDEFWATPARGGTCYPNFENMKQSIQQSDSLADFTLVTFHWGTELNNFPHNYQKEFAHLAIDWGADLVLGHHPHVLQGIEIYKNRLIAYSLGNFSFSSYSKSSTESIILKTYLTDAGLLYARVIPISVDNYQINFQPTILDSTAAEFVVNNLKKYSAPLNVKSIIDDAGFIWGDLTNLLGKAPQNQLFSNGLKK